MDTIERFSNPYGKYVPNMERIGCVSAFPIFCTGALVGLQLIGVHE